MLGILKEASHAGTLNKTCFSGSRMFGFVDSWSLEFIATSEDNSGDHLHEGNRNQSHPGQVAAGSKWHVLSSLPENQSKL